MIKAVIFCLIFLLCCFIANAISRMLNIKFPKVFNFILSPFGED